VFVGTTFLRYSPSTPWIIRPFQSVKKIYNDQKRLFLCIDFDLYTFCIFAENSAELQLLDAG